MRHPAISRRLATAMQFPPLAELTPLKRAAFNRRNAKVGSEKDMSRADRRLLLQSEASRKASK